MVIRFTSAVLWFVAMSWTSNFAGAFVGFPESVGYVAAAAVGLVIAMGPMKMLWTVQTRVVEPSRKRRADLSPVAQTAR